jgi:hypothetical protein
MISGVNTNKKLYFRLPLPYLDERNLRLDHSESLQEIEPKATCPDKYSSGTLSFR